MHVQRSWLSIDFKFKLPQEIELFEILHYCDLERWIVSDAKN